MGEFQNMVQRIEETGMYEVTQGGELYAELMAYAEGLDMIFGELEETEREAFVSTAIDKGLRMYEDVMDICNIDTSLEGRRKSILAALSVSDGDFTLGSLERMLDIYNISGSITESGNTLTLTIEDDLTAAQRTRIKDHLENLIPAGTTLLLGQPRRAPWARPLGCPQTCRAARPDLAREQAPWTLALRAIRVIVRSAHSALGRF